MTTNQERNSCHKCSTSNGPIKCLQCDRVFCYSDFQEHRQEIAENMRQVRIKCEDLGKNTTHYRQNMEDHPLMKAIDDWRKDAIMKVEQAVDIAKETLRYILSNHISQVEVTQQKCYEDIDAAHSAGDADEVKVQRWSAQVDELKAKIEQPSGVTVDEDPSTLVKPIRVCNTASIPPYPARWNPQDETVAHGLSKLYGLCVDEDQTMFITDCGYHHILAWKVGGKKGVVVAGGKIPGAGLDQLNHPTDAIVDQESDTLLICDRGNRRVMRWPRRPQLSGTASNSKGEIVIDGIDCFGLTIDDAGALYVSDLEKDEVRRYDKGGDKKGIVVAGGHGQGAGLHQLSRPTYLFADAQRTLYVSDSNNHRVMKWMPGTNEGIVVAGGNGCGEEVTQLSIPRGVWVDGCGHVYVADHGNYRVMRWEKGASQGTVVVGRNGDGNNLTELHRPEDLFFDRHGHLYVADSVYDRVQRFSLLSK